MIEVDPGDLRHTTLMDPAQHEPLTQPRIAPAHNPPTRRSPRPAQPVAPAGERVGAGTARGSGPRRSRSGSPGPGCRAGSPRHLQQTLTQQLRDHLGEEHPQRTAAPRPSTAIRPRSLSRCVTTSIAAASFSALPHRRTPRVPGPFESGFPRRGTPRTLPADRQRLSSLVRADRVSRKRNDPPSGPNTAGQALVSSVSRSAR